MSDEPLLQIKPRTIICMSLIAVLFCAATFVVAYRAGKQVQPPPIIIFDGTNYTAITNVVRVP